MRIISGSLRSRHLVFPKTKKTRPMTDRAKEMIFDILGTSVADGSVLDLFAGSGSLGLEALSRGAEEVVFVEKAPWGLKSIRENLFQLGLKDKAAVIVSDALLACRRLEKKGKTFTQIFLDPPYNKGLVKKMLICLDRSAIVTPLTQIIVHHSRQEKLPEKLENLVLLREKKVGQACLSFLSRKS